MYSSALSLKSSVPGEQLLAADAASILKQAVESKMIDLACLCEQIEMKKNQEILHSHKYKITHCVDGKWYTNLPNGEKTPKKIKRSTREALEKAIVEYYRDYNKQLRQQDYGFENWWNIWKERQVSFGVVDNTVQKYESDYERFFRGTEFEKKDIRKINEEDITAFMVERIRTLGLKDKAGKALWGQIAGVFKTARIRRIITEDPCPYVDTKLFNKFYNKEQKPVEERILSHDEIDMLKEQLERDHEKKPCYIPAYAVELAIYTGMRVGELAALKWSDVLFPEKIIIISKSEKHNRATNEYVISDTKTRKIRHFPMEEKLADFLKNLMKIQLKNGLLGEFVFSNEKGRITARAISECMRYKCKQVGIPERGIHALRRTLNSRMRCNGVSAIVAASLLGHTEEVNQTNYTYDISNMDSKREIIRKAIS